MKCKHEKEAAIAFVPHKEKETGFPVSVFFSALSDNYDLSGVGQLTQRHVGNLVADDCGIDTQ